MTSNVRATVEPLGRRPSTLARLGTWSFLHRRRAIAAWLLLLIAITGIARVAGSAFRDDFSGGNAPSQQAQVLLARTFPAEAGDHAEIVFHAAIGLGGQPAGRVEALLRAARELPNVSSVTDPLAPTGAPELTRDGRTGYAVVQFDRTSDRLPSTGPNGLIRLVQRANSRRLHVVVGGTPIRRDTNREGSEAKIRQK